MADTAQAQIAIPGSFIEFRKEQEHKLHNGLCDDEGLGQLLKAQMHLLHLYWGNHEERGSFRLTALDVDSPPDGSPMQAVAAQTASWRDHASAFRKHVAVFGSHRTLLRWVYLSFQRAKTLEMSRDITNRRYSLRFECRLIDEHVAVEPDNNGVYDQVIVFSPSLLECLWPVNTLQEDYHRAMYAKGDIDPSYRDYFLLCRGQAISLLKATHTGLKTANRLGADFAQTGIADPNLAARAFLASLQSAAIYLSLFLKNTEDIVFDFHCYSYRVPVLGATNEKPPMLTLFSLGPDRVTENTLTPIINKLTEYTDEVYDDVKACVEHLPNWKHYVCDESHGLVMRKGTRDTPKDEWLKHLKELDRHFHFHDFTEWRKAVTAWLTSLICCLRSEKHEGCGLGFWFAFGDLSEVLDSDDFVLKRAVDEHIAALAVPIFPPYDDRHNMHDEDSLHSDFEGMVADAREIALKEAAKENYAWFEGSRYAVFWDVAFPNPCPIGLLRPKHSNWEWYAQTREREEDVGAVANRRPKLALAYKRPNGSGAVLVDGKYIARLTVHPDRDQTIAYWIHRLGSPYVDEGTEQLAPEMKLLCRIAVRVADDPDAGCCIVFLAGDAKPQTAFVKMANEWQLQDPIRMSEEHTDDIACMLATDGATCVYLDGDNWKIGFRYLLQDNGSSIVEKLIEWTNNRKTCVLRGTGSRRWSGAVAAAREDVAMVLVVSQDGDMHVFQRDEQDGEIVLKHSMSPNDSSTLKPEFLPLMKE